MKNFLKSSLIITALISAISCTPTGGAYVPVVDTANPAYSQDLADCQRLAQEFLDLGYDSAVRAGTAGAVGAGLGQMVGGNTKGTLIGAGVGLAAAGVGKTLQTTEDRKDIIAKCLSGRGYRVLK